MDDTPSAKLTKESGPLLDDADRPTKRARTDEPEQQHCFLRDMINPVSVQVSILILKLQPLYIKYDFSTVSIISSSKIEPKVKTVLARLDKFNWAKMDGKPPIVTIVSRTGMNNKVATVAEIAKRQIEVHGGKWWQYTRLEKQLIEVPKTIEKPVKEPSANTDKDADADAAEERQFKEYQEPQDLLDEASSLEWGKKTENSAMADADDGEDDEEAAFEPYFPKGNELNKIAMRDNEPEKVTKEGAGVLFVYLTKVPVSELDDEYS